MEIASGFWARFFGVAKEWNLRLDGNHLVALGGPEQQRFDLHTIMSVALDDGVVWSTISLRLADRWIRFPGASRSAARRFRQHAHAAIVDALHREIAKHAGLSTATDRELDEFYATPRYLANRDALLWIASFGRHASRDQLLGLLKHPLIRNDPRISALLGPFVRLQDLAAGDRHELAQRNKRFVADELEKHRQLFDTVERQPLTEEQRHAVVVMEDRNLVVAAAGSGKSSTVVAKLAYALETSSCAPNEILALAFNSSAAKELRERIEVRLSERFAGVEQVQAETFHRLGLDIIATVDGKRPDLAPWAAETGDNQGGVIEELVAELTARNPKFWLNWITLRAVCARPNKELPRFESQQDYNEYLRQDGEERDGRSGIRTLNGELVKSREELAIANWLFVNGIPYEYERSYEYDTADQQHRQYHPDFFYPDINCYHEHFALDDNGYPPSFLGRKYAEGVDWKRATHESRSTGLIETTSAMYRSDSLFQHLETELRARGQEFRPRSPAEIEEHLKSLKLPSFAGFIRTFIVLAKSNEMLPELLAAKAGSQRDRFRARVFIEMIAPLMAAYEEKLRAIGCIDFEDMILVAARHVEAGRYVHPFKMIAVDEFQDISRCRARLVKALLNQRPDCRLFAVGDDWQSVYRFAGSDQKIFVGFPQEFGVTHTAFLTQTFRSNQGITDVSSAFVRANPDQITKRITALDQRRASTVHILEYVKDEHVDEVLRQEIAAIAASVRGRSAHASVLILGRYRHLRPAGLTKWRHEFEDSLNLRFLTVHRSKGLEADYVFVVGVNSGSYAFPSTHEDDPLLEMVLPSPEKFESAEERRLFYVGLTRARHRTYVLTKRRSSSRFIHELMSLADAGQVVYRAGVPTPKRVHAEPCTNCHSGVLREVVGKHGTFLGCSNYPVCKQTRKPRAVRVE